MELTPHFTLEELLESDTATRLEIKEQFQVDGYTIENLTALATHALEPVRELAGEAIHISSGYRCEKVNTLIGGSKTSQHVKGQAADIKAANLTVEELYQLIKDSEIEYDQLIQEFNKWVHISYRISGNRRENLRATKKDGKTVYSKD